MPIRDLRVRMIGEDETGSMYEQAAGNARSFGDKAMDLLGKAGLGAGGLFAYGLVQSMGSEELADRTAANLALTGPQAEAAGKASGQLFSGAFTDSMDEANSAVESVMSSIGGMRDASADDLEAVTGAALNLSNAMGIDVARSSQVAGQMLTNGLAASGQEAFDLLTAGLQQIPVNVREDLLDATDEYGQFFNQLGYTGEQAMALLVDASAQGSFGIDKLGDSLKEFGIRATDLGDTGAQQALEQLGLSGEDVANRLLAGGATAQSATQQIVAGLQGISDPAVQAQAATALFGTQLEDMNKGDIPGFLSQLTMASGELENVAGSADRFGAALTDNASSKLQAWRQAAQQGLVDFVGGTVVPALEGLYNLMIGGDFTGALSEVFGWEEDSAAVDFLLTVRDNVIALWPHVQTAGAWVLNLAQVALPALWSAVSVAATAIGGVVSWFAQGSLGAQILAGVIGAVLLPMVIVWGVNTLASGARVVAGWALASTASVVGAATQVASSAATVAGWVLAGTQSLLQGARMAAAWVIAMGPVGWVIAAVVGLVALIVANWDTVVRWTTTAWNAVTGALSAAWEWIKGVVASGAQWVLDRVAWFGQLPGRVAGWFGGVRDAAVAKLNELVSWVGGLPGSVLGAIGSFGSLLLSAGRDLLTGLWQGIQNGKNWLLGKIGDFFGNLLPGWARTMLGIRSPSTVFAEMGRYLMEGMAVGIDDGSGMAIHAVTDAANRVTAAGQASASFDASASGAFGLGPAAGSAVGGMAGGGGMAGFGGDALLARLIEAIASRPTIGTVEVQDNETAGELAQRLAFAARTA